MSRSGKRLGTALAFALWVLLGAGVLCGDAGRARAGAPAKPKVPIGVDPGGVGVAVIGDGIDYTRPEIATRLARDGEGEIIGFDFIDHDRRPYAAAARQEPCPTPTDATAGSTCRDEHPAVTVLRHAPAARIGIFRVGSEPRQLAEAIAMVAQSPVRIVLFQAAPPADLLREAAKRFQQLSFKVPEPAKLAYPADLRQLPNVSFGCREQPVPVASLPEGACGSAALQAALETVTAASVRKP